jgi:hypothetical protein
MRIDNEFTVGAPVDEAWTVLTDIERIAPCMPGAQLTGSDGDVHSGKVKIKVGPVVAQYAGTVRFAEKDDAAHRAVIDAKGRDTRGAGNASAMITAELREDGGRTRVTVATDLKISGKLAQFGSGMIKEVSTKLLTQFVDCLETKLAAESPDGAGTGSPAAPAPPGQEPVRQTAPNGADPAGSAAPGNPNGAEPASGAASAAEPGRTATEAAAGSGGAAADDDAAPLDLMAVAGGSIYKRVIPVAIVLVVIIVALVVYFVVT